MNITKQQLKQLIKEEVFKLEEVGYIRGEPGSEEHDADLEDWASGFTGDPNDPLPSTVAKRSADLEAAKTLVSAMDPEELEQLQQHISDTLTEPAALDLSAAARRVGDVTAPPGINKDLDRLKRIAKRTVGGGR